MFALLSSYVVTKAKCDFATILKVLIEHQVDFILVGGVCAVLHGAPVSTFDIDLVHSRAPKNIDRLMIALKKLDAHYRELQSQFEIVVGASPFSLSKELKSPIEIVSSALESIAKMSHFLKDQFTELVHSHSGDLLPA